MTTIAERCSSRVRGLSGRAPVLARLATIIAIAAATAHSGEAGAADGTGNTLIGTWRLVSAKYDGEDVTFEKGSTTVKHVTPTHFMWVTYDQDGEVTRTAGGSHTVQGGAYEEMPEYGLGQGFHVIKGKAQRFTWKVDGNRWHHAGTLSNGLVTEEVWERVGKK
jgi:hypothetical protein